MLLTNRLYSNLPNIVICYYTSNMILHIDSDTAYLVLPNTKSRIVGYFYLSSKLSMITELILNTPVLVICKTLCYIISLAVEAEIVGVFIND